MPGPSQAPLPTILRQEQIPPVVLELDPLADLDPTRRPDPADHAPQAHPPLIGLPHDTGRRHASRVEGGCQPPFLHASCAAGEAWMYIGWGTLGAHRRCPNKA